MRIGPIANADGTTPADVRLAKTGEQVIGQAHGKYYEAAHRGNLFAANAPSATPGTALGTAAAFSLFNPQNSGVRVAIKKVSIGYMSGTLGAGTIVHCADPSNNQTAPSGGTTLTANCLDIGRGTIACAKPKQNSTLANNPKSLYPICSVSQMAGLTDLQLAKITDDVDGAIVLEPGMTYSAQEFGGAGTSPLVVIGCVWEEIPIV